MNNNDRYGRKIIDNICYLRYAATDTTNERYMANFDQIVYDWLIG